ncbi:hypothetical protein CSCA_0643 [Clostridium scatologenes]|uniref:Uncharacterized protein n=1 Tax=Clostridium scatologenes TaxID=1548 RepID=A0A0E3JX50_CLOSL|nr:hypothetical protein CSCA_0643 [Clostridium scatologenes]
MYYVFENIISYCRNLVQYLIHNYSIKSKYSTMNYGQLEREGV